MRSQKACALSTSVWRLLTVAVFFIAIISGQSVPIFHSEVFQIHVDAEVVDESGRPITGLGRDDFQISDCGESQSVVALSESEQPLELVLLFDTSGSMSRHTKNLPAVAHQALKQLIAGDRVLVMAFSTGIRILAPFSLDPDEVEDAIRAAVGIRARGGTRIQDAVYDAANQFPTIPSRQRMRRAILVVTDNRGKPARSKAAVLERLSESDVLLSGLILHSLPALADLSGRPMIGGIEDLVAKTGGDFIRTNDIATAFPEAMHRLRSRYTLYYRLPEGEVGAFRAINVQLSESAHQRYPAARVIVRSGYRLKERDRYGFSAR